MFAIATASGNSFAYAWDDLPGASGPAWARALCAGMKLDGLFLLGRPVPGRPWTMEHWDADGASTFCSNGTRAALALADAPGGASVEVLSNGEAITLRRDGPDVAILMPSGAGTGFFPLPQAMASAIPQRHAFGWVGNPQLVIAMDDVENLDLGELARPLRHHPDMAGGTNVNVVQVLGPGCARVRSWERGVEGETSCCGTGCAVTAAWLARETGITTWRLLPRGVPVKVTVALKGEGWRELWLSGPVQHLGTLLPDPSLLS